MTLSRFTIALPIALASISFAARPAAAESLEPGVELELTYAASSGATPSTSAFAPEARLFFGIAPPITLGVTWGVAAGSIESVGTEVRLLNPLIAGAVGLDLSVLELRVGAGIAPPLAQADDAQDALRLGVISAGHGFYNTWRYAPDTLSIVVPAEIELSAGVAAIRADAALAMMLATANTDARKTVYLFQIGAEASFDMGPLGAGLRLQAVNQTSGVDSALVDASVFQTSAEPFISLGMGPLEARVGLTLNIDSPAGFSFADDGTFWGLHASAAISI